MRGNTTGHAFASRRAPTLSLLHTQADWCGGEPPPSLFFSKSYLDLSRTHVSPDCNQEIGRVGNARECSERTYTISGRGRRSTPISTLGLARHAIFDCEPRYSPGRDAMQGTYVRTYAAPANVGESPGWPGAPSHAVSEHTRGVHGMPRGDSRGNRGTPTHPSLLPDDCRGRKYG